MGSAGSACTCPGYQAQGAEGQTVRPVSISLYGAGGGTLTPYSGAPCCMEIRSPHLPSRVLAPVEQVRVLGVHRVPKAGVRQ